MGEALDADLVFLHGFWSSPSTWDQLCETLSADTDLKGLRLHKFGYESPKLRLLWSHRRIPDYDDIAQSLPSYLDAVTASDAPICLISHSQGGLILQRFLAWMLGEGRGHDLARIRLIVMLSCPNEGSEYLASIRAVTRFNRHPQARDLQVLADRVVDARRTILRQIVNADAVSERQCPIPVYVYSGRSDRVVSRQSAQSAFPRAGVLPGDHFSILHTRDSSNLTSSTLKRHILTHLATQSALEQMPPEILDGLAGVLSRRSDERRRGRLLPFDLDRARLVETLDVLRDTVPTVPLGSSRTLVGSFGAGKSEIAEEWHRQKIAEFIANDSAPLPIWLAAREVAKEGLARAIEGSIGSDVFRSRGIALVVDGLDEIDGAAAESISADVRVLVAGDGLSSALLTTRPGVVPVTQEHIAVEGLTETNARQLVERVADNRQATWGWTPELIATIRRPFFALAAGTLMSAGGFQPGQVDLVSKLVERALGRAHSANLATGADVYDLLVELSVSLTNSNGASDGLTFQKRQMALRTRLVSADSAGELSFSLPIFEQWFAAQALAEDANLIDRVLTDPRSFDRWRWAIAVAVSGASSERVDELIRTCLRFNVGAGAWIIDQASDGRSYAPASGNRESLDFEPTSKRVLRAMRVWVNALGELAPRVFPIDSSTDPIHLGMRFGDGSGSLAWMRSPVSTDQVVPLRPEFHILDRGEEWSRVWSGRLPSGSQWPWTRIRDDIAGTTLKILNERANLGSPDGMSALELRHRTARVIARHLKLPEPFERLALIDAGKSLLAEHAGAVRVIFRLGAKEVTGEEITDLVNWLNHQTFERFERPLPGPDIATPRGGWIWDFYSPEQLTRFSVEMLGHACAIYEEMADSTFSAFGWSLGMNACRPVGILGSLEYQESGVADSSPGLTYAALPMGLFQMQVQGSTEHFLSTNGRAAVRLERKEIGGKSWLADSDAHWERVIEWCSRNGVGPFWNLPLVHTVVECGHERPATLLAANWIWDDLRRLGLATGTFPQLPG